MKGILNPKLCKTILKYNTLKINADLIRLKSSMGLKGVKYLEKKVQTLFITKKYMLLNSQFLEIVTFGLNCYSDH